MRKDGRKEARKVGRKEGRDGTKLSGMKWKGMEGNGTMTAWNAVDQ